MRLPPGVTKTEWERVRQIVLESATTCAECGRGLVPEARPRSRWHTEVDHEVPLAALRHLDPAEQAALALDLGNLRALHKSCNARKRDRRPRRRPQSQKW